MVVVSRVISPLIWVISIVTLLITTLITTHEPPSKALHEIMHALHGWLDSRARRKYSHA